MSFRHRTVIALLAGCCVWACEDATTVKLVEIDATGAVFGAAYLDTNGNGALDGQDSPLRHAAVVLTVAGGGQVVDSAVTDTSGVFVLLNVPVGTYRLDLAPSALGDSLEAFGEETELEIQRGDTTRVNFGVSFPVLTLEEVRSAEVGRRVFTTGIAMNPRQPFGDGLVHLQADSLYLRATNVARASLNAGDSVRFLGRVQIDQGQPVLDDVTPTILVSSATVPIAAEATASEAADARGGTLDAALVRVRRAEISDTATVDGVFQFTIDDGTGPVDVVFRPFLLLNNAAIRPDTVLRVSQVTGLLVPVLSEAGATRWRILPRGGGDVLLEVKQADVGVNTTVDKASVSKGDTLLITVVLTNAGPLGASGVQVTDSVPQGLTFLSATATQGAYDQATSLWSLDSLRAGARDTLRIRAQVTTDLFGQSANTAVVTRLLNEVDPSAGNNVSSAPFLIVQKLSDLGLALSLDRPTASKGDTLTFTLVATNAGPREASGVQVTDSVPFGLTFRSATTTRGGYDQGTGIWDLGSVPVGASDTLRIRAEVTTDLLGQGGATARISRLLEGGDPNQANDQATMIFTVVARPEPE